MGAAKSYLNMPCAGDKAKLCKEAAAMSDQLAADEIYQESHGWQYRALVYVTRAALLRDKAFQIRRGPQL